jgi:hypothetical protein
MGRHELKRRAAQYDLETGLTPHDDHFDAVIVPHQESPAILRHFSPVEVTAAESG